jgi:chromate transporter
MGIEPATTAACDVLGATAAQECERVSLAQLLAVFVKLGCLAFGGGMAIIAFMEEELVGKRHVIPPDKFLNGVALGQVLGPMAVNTSFFVGYCLYGPIGGLLSLLAFVMPSVVLVIGIGWLYAAHQSLAVLRAALAGLQPAVIALIVSAAWSMSKKAVRRWPGAILCTAGLVAGLGKITTVYILAVGALCGVLLGSKRLLGADNGSKPTATKAPALPGRRQAITCPLAAAALASSAAISLSSIGSTFFKLGLIWFGGAYTIVPLMYQRIVENLGWISPETFRDGVAIASLTPGPMSVLATFAGYRVHGFAGALAATFALYVPATALMLFFCRNYERMLIEGRTRDMLNGLNPCVVGLILSAGVLLSKGVLVNYTSWALVVASFVLLVRFKWSPAYVLGLNAAVGVLLQMG